MLYDAYVYDMNMMNMRYDEYEHKTKSLTLNVRPRFKGTVTKQV